jgi:hypothetical protein
LWITPLFLGIGSIWLQHWYALWIQSPVLVLFLAEVA